jgi:hypothetical protein
MVLIPRGRLAAEVDSGLIASSIRSKANEPRFGMSVTVFDTACPERRRGHRVRLNRSHSSQAWPQRPRA